jgi:hypothetical protein
VSSQVTVVTDGFSSAPQSRNCQARNLLLTDRRRVREFSTMSPSNAKATMRMVVASFAAGASAMAIVGLIAPVAMKGGLSIREAFAAEVERNEPLIQPLDVEAIQAQLEEADAAMAAMRATTDDDIARLERLTR